MKLPFVDVSPHERAEHEHLPFLDDLRPVARLHTRWFLRRRHRAAAREAFAALDQLRHGSPRRLVLPQRVGAPRKPLLHQLGSPPLRVIGHAALLLLVLLVTFTGGWAELPMRMDWAQGRPVATDAVTGASQGALTDSGSVPPIVVGPAIQPSVAADVPNDALVPSRITPAKNELSAFTGTHVVAPGETLGQIAAHDNVSVTTLVSANRIDPQMFAIGQTLRIPRVPGLPHVVVAGETLEQIAELYNVSIDAIRNVPGNTLATERTLVPGEELFIAGAVAIGNGPSQADLANVAAVPVVNVREDATRVRSGPGTAYDNLGTLVAATPVVLIGRYEDWLNVRTPDGSEGWIAAELLSGVDGLVDQVPVVADVPPLPTPAPVVAAPTPAPTPRWVWPAVGDLTSGYGYRNFSVGRFHNGYDIANTKNTPVRAAGAGRVVEAGWCSGYGYCVKIEHGNGLTSEYGHMAAQPYVRTGQQVDAGTVIGPMGMTYDRKGGGYATGVHVHFTMRQNGTPINPATYIR